MQHDDRAAPRGQPRERGLHGRPGLHGRTEAFVIRPAPDNLGVMRAADPDPAPSIPAEVHQHPDEPRLAPARIESFRAPVAGEAKEGLLDEVPSLLRIAEEAGRQAVQL